jgi:hydroxymethylpyrimidine pyrophosphatase-like HAD family hydrolase
MTTKNNSFQSSKNKRHEAVIFDLDGTLALTSDPKGHHKIDHDGFRAKVRGAVLNEDIAEKLKDAKKQGDEVVILTARSAHYRQETQKWLHENGVHYDSLIMRPTDDNRKDKVVKRDLLLEDVVPKFNVREAFDDKKKNRKMYEKEGIDAKKVK